MRAVAVYRLDYGSKAGYRIRHPIGSVLERRNHERMDNANDLLWLARKRFALDAADENHIVTEESKARRGGKSSRS